MPELPEIEALRETLDASLRGRRPTGVAVRQVALLKTFEPPLEALVDEPLIGTRRRGKHLVLDWDHDVSLVIHLGIGGRLVLGNGRTLPRAISLEIVLDEGSPLRVVELGTKKRSSVHVLRTDAVDAHLAHLGPDALDPALTSSRLADILQAERSQLKRVLTDQRRIAGIGNAYSDEILWQAQLAPLRMSTTLDDAEIERLRQAIVDVSTQAVERARTDNYLLIARGDERGTFAVHRRDKQPCPRCGALIASIFFAESALQYCPTCQVEGRTYADRRLSRLLR
jgi:formamidopyrimidine-DNA glycosylase